jgi:outer membrane protein assembly factor BamB
MRWRVLAILSLMLAVAPLAGCAAPSLGSLNPFKKEKPRLEGERVSVIAGPEEGDLAPGAAPRPVSLPPQSGNANWTQPGGTPGNAPGHLSLAGELKTAWRSDAGRGASSYGRPVAVPLVYDGKVYTLDAGGQVTAFSAASGGVVWRKNLTPENERSREGFGGGLAIDGGRVFVTSGFGYAAGLDAGSGDLLWSKKIGTPLRSSPTAANGRVYFVSTESILYALNANDGAELWTGRGLPEQAALLSNVSPAVAGDIVIVPYPSGELIAYRASDGSPVWTDSLSTSRVGTSLTALSDPARPAIDRGVVYAISHAGRMIAASQNGGDRLWSRNVRGVQTPWVAGDTVFVVDVSGRLMALSRSDGAVKWSAELPKASRWSGPVLAGDRLWLVSAKGLVVGADPRSGQIVSQADLRQDVFIQPVVAAGRMYIFTDKASLVALN